MQYRRPLEGLSETRLQFFERCVIISVGWNVVDLARQMRRLLRSTPFLRILQSSQFPVREKLQHVLDQQQHSV
jgi:hypothetical protein